jgi:predicted transcriptional regulator
LVEKAAGSAEAAAEKRQFLVHIDADLIRQIKILAIDRSVTASSLVQQAITEFLSRGGQSQTGAGHWEQKP